MNLYTFPLALGETGFAQFLLDCAGSLIDSPTRVEHVVSGLCYRVSIHDAEGDARAIEDAKKARKAHRALTREQIEETVANAYIQEENAHRDKRARLGKMQDNITDALERAARWDEDRISKKMALKQRAIEFLRDAAAELAGEIAEHDAAAPVRQDPVAWWEARRAQLERELLHAQAYAKMNWLKNSEVDGWSEMIIASLKGPVRSRMDEIDSTVY